MTERASEAQRKPIRVPIEKRIPLPAQQAKRHAHAKYDWGGMQIGDSILLKLPRSSVSPQLTRAHRKTGFFFAVRKVAGGVRVWRVPEDEPTRVKIVPINVLRRRRRARMSQARDDAEQLPERDKK